MFLPPANTPPPVKVPFAVVENGVTLFTCDMLPNEVDELVAAFALHGEAVTVTEVA